MISTDHMVSLTGAPKVLETEAEYLLFWTKPTDVSVIFSCTTAFFRVEVKFIQANCQIRQL